MQDRMASNFMESVRKFICVGCDREVEWVAEDESICEWCTAFDIVITEVPITKRFELHKKGNKVTHTWLTN